jgi:biotin carboxyl carrier protein
VKSEWKDGARTRSVDLQSLGPERWRARVDDADLELTAEPLAGGRLRLVTPAGVVVAEVTAAGARRFVRLGSLDFVLERETTGRSRSRGAPEGGLEAPMPGAVTRVLVTSGDAVTKGQPLLAVEAMKMEHLIRAPRAGRVKAVRAEVGDMVAPGVALIELEPEPDASNTSDAA